MIITYNIMGKYLLIDSIKLPNFFRKKSSNNQFLVKIVEQLSFGKVKVEVHYNDIMCPNYIGTTIVDFNDIKEADKNIYCFEVQTTKGHCRLTCSRDEYTALNSLSTDDEKLKFINNFFKEYSGEPNAIKFIKTFTTTDKHVFIGNLDGIYSEY